MRVRAYPGDVVKYGPYDWQWGRVIARRVGEVKVQRLYAKWHPLSELRIIIPAEAYTGLLSTTRAQTAYLGKK